MIKLFLAIAFGWKSEWHDVTKGRRSVGYHYKGKVYVIEVWKEANDE